MRQKTVIQRVLVLVLVFSLFTSSSASTSAAAFLKIPTGARERAIGQTGVSHSVSANALYWNPALLAFGEREVRFGAFRWLVDSRGSLGAVKFRARWGGIGANYFNLSTPGFEARSRPGPVEAEFTLHQAYLTLGAAYLVRSDLSIGASVKGWVEDIYGDRAGGLPVFDAGAAYRRGGWMTGIAAANLGEGWQNDPLPAVLRSGIARQFNYGDFGLLNAAEYSIVHKNIGRIHFGAEADYLQSLFLRAGWFGNSQVSQLLFGLGVAHSIYRFDASIAPFDEGLGAGWRVGIGVKI